ncbi:MAG: RDD family protein, partial [bacterium]|nr:RDD family protein [bacterium]
ETEVELENALAAFLTEEENETELEAQPEDDTEFAAHDAIYSAEIFGTEYAPGINEDSNTDEELSLSALEAEMADELDALLELHETPDIGPADNDTLANESTEKNETCETTNNETGEINFTLIEPAAENLPQSFTDKNIEETEVELENALAAFLAEDENETELEAQPEDDTEFAAHDAIYSAEIFGTEDAPGINEDSNTDEELSLSALEAEMADELDALLESHEAPDIKPADNETLTNESSEKNETCETTNNATSEINFSLVEPAAEDLPQYIPDEIIEETEAELGNALAAFFAEEETDNDGDIEKNKDDLENALTEISKEDRDLSSCPEGDVDNAPINPELTADFVLVNSPLRDIINHLTEEEINNSNEADCPQQKAVTVALTLWEDSINEAEKNDHSSEKTLSASFFSRDTNPERTTLLFDLAIKELTNPKSFTAYKEPISEIVNRNLDNRRLESALKVYKTEEKIVKEVKKERQKKEAQKSLGIYAEARISDKVTLAPLWRRSLGLTVDLLCQISIGIAGLLLMPELNRVFDGLQRGALPDLETTILFSFDAFAAIAVLWVITAVLLNIGRGQSLGQWTAGLEVVDYDGHTPSVASCAMRAFCLPMSFFLLPLNLVMLLIRKQPIHDTLCRTAVIKAKSI